jgi:hypothetical protein
VTPERYRITNDRISGLFCSNTPGDVTIADLREELAVTTQAVAARLRRGTETVVVSTLPGTRPLEGLLINVLYIKKRD